MARIKTLIVDDSALIRALLTKLLSRDPDIDVVGAAADPYQARQMIKELHPDVLTLDIEMPKMDGLTFLEKIMALHPMPVVMISSLTQNNAAITIRALEMGAVDFFAKPKLDLQRGIENQADELIQKVKVAAKAKVKAHRQSDDQPTSKIKASKFKFSTTEKIIVVGASTGGVEALRTVLSGLPANSPAVLVTQHMPENFTTQFAQRLNTLCAMAVSEATQGERVLPGHVYIAPGSQHLQLKRSGANYICALSSDPPVSGHRPSVDVLFKSAVESAGANAVGVILTGMGKDGASGLFALRNTGAKTLGQNEESSVVYGMPRAAFELGAVEKQLDIHDIAEGILDSCGPATDRHMRV